MQRASRTSIPKMGKCYPIIHFLDFGGISHLYSQSNRLMERAIKKSVSWVSPVSTVPFRGAYNGAYGSWPITGSDSTSLAAHHPDPQKYTGPSNAEGKAARFFHGTGRGNDDVGYGQAARGAASRSPRRPPQDARPKPDVLTIKAGMWFCFKGIVLATPPSIKDSEGDPRGGAAGPHPLERGAGASHGVRLGPVAEGVET